MDKGLYKWLPFYSPLYRGRFSFTTGETCRRLDTWAQGTIMTNGRFWVRPQGGHNLRISDTRAPLLRDPIVGTADIGTFVITEWAALASNLARQRHLYMVTAVGGGGVEESAPRGVLEVTLNGFAGLSNPLPNPVSSLRVVPRADGSFSLFWVYDKTGEAAPPAEFAVYSDSGTGTINFSAAIAAVTYQPETAHYSFNTSVLAGPGGLQRFLFVVRARKSIDNEERNNIVVRASNSTDPQNTTQTTYPHTAPGVLPSLQTESP